MFSKILKTFMVTNSMRQLRSQTNRTTVVTNSPKQPDFNCIPNIRGLTEDFHQTEQSQKLNEMIHVPFTLDHPHSIK